MKLRIFPESFSQTFVAITASFYHGLIASSLESKLLLREYPYPAICTALMLFPQLSAEIFDIHKDKLQGVYFSSLNIPNVMSDDKVLQSFVKLTEVLRALGVE